MRASQLVRTKAKVPTLFLNPATLISEQNNWSNRDPPPWGLWEVRIRKYLLQKCTAGRVKENPLIFPLEHVVSGRRSPGTSGSGGDRKSLDEGAHYGGERWEEVRVAEYQVLSTEYRV